MDKELENNIIKCSRCGLCMEVCPVYKAKRVETVVSRGKFLQLLGLIKKELKFDKNVSYNLDLCLACGKCKKACPSDIDAVKIFASVKEEYQTPQEKLFYSAPALKLKMLALKILYKIKYPFGKRKTKPVKEKGNVAYFKGCLTGAVGSGLNSSFKKEKFSCCALPFYVKGRFDLYEKYKNRNLKLIEKYDKVVFDCATCYDTVLNYEGVDPDKIVYFTDYYKGLNLASDKKIKVTFHKPCHLPEEKFYEIEEILKGIKNVEYVRMEGAFDCCGFGGDFFTRHLKTASFLSGQKAENFLNSGADIILTTCPTCLWSLKYGIKMKHGNKKALDLVEFLGSLN